MRVFVVIWRASFFGKLCPYSISAESEKAAVEEFQDRHPDHEAVGVYPLSMLSIPDADLLKELHRRAKAGKLGREDLWTIQEILGKALVSSRTHFIDKDDPAYLAALSAVSGLDEILHGWEHRLDSHVHGESDDRDQGLYDRAMEKRDIRENTNEGELNEC